MGIAALALFLLSAAPSLQAADGEAFYRFGVVPQQSAGKIARLWTPILDHLSLKSGHRLEVETARDIPEFERRLAAGRYDFAYMNPYHFTVYHDDPGYQAVARQKNKRIQGVFVAPRESPIDTLEDLRGKTLAFPSPAAFAASILPRGHLKKAGIDFTPAYVSSHDSVYLAVSRGLYPGGGGVLRTFRNTDPKAREKLRVLWKTDLYTPHAIAAHPRVSSTVVEAVRAAMLAMGGDPKGGRLLKAISFKQGFEAARNEDWDDVRSLGIRLLDVPVRQE